MVQLVRALPFSFSSTPLVVRVKLLWPPERLSRSASNFLASRHVEFMSESALNCQNLPNDQRLEANPDDAIPQDRLAMN